VHVLSSHPCPGAENNATAFFDLPIDVATIPAKCGLVKE